MSPLRAGGKMVAYREPAAWGKWDKRGLLRDLSCDRRAICARACRMLLERGPICIGRQSESSTCQGVEVVDIVVPQGIAKRVGDAPYVVGDHVDFVLSRLPLSVATSW